MRRTLTILAALAAAVVFVPAAQAGCVPAAGIPAVYPGGGAIDSNSGVNCTTGNAPAYEVHIYYQGDAGGWHSVNLNDPLVFRLNLPTSQNYRWFTAIQCAYWQQADTHARTKVTVKNLSTGVTGSPGYSSAMTLPSNCF